MIKKRIANIIAISMCFVLLSLSACSGEIKNPDTFVIAEISDVVSLDPAYAYDTVSAAQILNIYETLIRFDSDSTSEFVPGLATEWTISPDGKTYRFKIREGVTFHNGNPLTPEDVEYSFERGMVQDYALGPQWMFFEPLFGLGVYTSRTETGLIPLAEIKGKVEVDGQWVQFNLATPYEPFLQILASSWGSIVDMEWCIQNGDWTGTEESYQDLNNPAPGGSPIHSIACGTGPFILELWEPGIQIRLVRNDDYWGTPASFGRVLTQVVDEWGTRYLMLQLGDVDCAIVPGGQIPEVKAMPGILVYDAVPTLLNQAFFFQFDIDPYSTLIGSGQLDGNGIPTDFFGDVDVRKGFAYAFDWDTYIADAMAGYGHQRSSPIVEGIPYYKSDWPSYGLNLVRAEEHLRAAWNGSLWENGFEMTLVHASGDDAGEIACEILQNNLFEINPLFRINIQLMAWPTMLDAMTFGRIPMYINGWTADYPDPHNFVFPYMHSEGAFARAQRYSNEAADDLIEEAISSSNHSERQILYDQIAELYYDEVPSIMIGQLLGVYFFRDWIHGFVYNPIRPMYEMYAYYLSKG
ncbi:MAG: ABC transporter substrate-binding protein [Dehalococcoidia bacterium]|nr:ABC transporter substrate-binding protein [Dehalococcoidia bacterium]MDH4299634.1 ABC transporter substrate-binding protein [Dehalococcoidia bacterium]MDH4367231.1 ABC transporter substrate-binding protein [Dehalococcoidia bacterium]